MILKTEGGCMKRCGVRMSPWRICCVMTALAVFCGGCAVSVGTGYPWLEPVPMPDGPYVMTQGRRILVAVGPVDVPGYITRAAMIVDMTPNPLNISSADEEASVLEWEIPRVIAENVRRLLAPYGVEAARYSPGKNSDYRIKVDIVTFEIARSEILETGAKWVLYGPDGKSLMMEKDISFSTPLKDRGDGGRRSAMSLALADLSREIVKDLLGVLGVK